MRTPCSLRRCIATASFASVLLAFQLPTRAFAAPGDPITATNEQKLQAQRLFLKGRDLAAKKKCDEAVVEFRASLVVVASPNARFALARCLIETGKLPDAYTELTKTMNDARALAAREARYGDTADAADVERKEVAAKIVLLTIKVDHATEGTSVKVGDRELTRDALHEPIPVMPGTIEIIVTNAGKEVARTTLTVGPGETTVSLDAEPPSPKPPEPPAKPPGAIDPNDIPKDDPKPLPPPPPPAPAGGLRTTAYIAGGVGAAGFIAFGIFGALEKGTFSDLQTACHNGPCPPSKADTVSAGKTQQTIANIGLVVGAVGVSTGVVLFILSSPKSTPGGGTASVVVTPGWIGLRGSL